MANISGAYDANAEPQDDFSPIPAGEYRAEIIDSDVIDISQQSNKGRCLKLTWKVIEGDFAGRLIWQRLNLWPENMSNMDKVVQIAESQFASVRNSTGQKIPQDSTELHHIPCIIRVKVRKDPNGQYEDQNEISNVKAAGSGAPPPMTPAQPAQRQAPPQANSQPAQQQNRPWGNSRPAA